MADRALVLTVSDIARACHESNRQIQQVIGDPNPSPPWDDAPRWQRDSCIQGVERALRHDTITPEDLHRAWCAAKVADGWVWGPEKDPDKKTHPCLLPYDALPEGQRVKDQVFLTIVDALRPYIAR